MIDWGLVIKIGVTLAVVILPAAGGIAYLVVKRWGEKYVDSKFDRAMEKLKYAHQFEIELLKGSVQGEVSRAARFFEQEFTALSESHKLLIRSVSSAQDLLNRLQQAPGLVGLTDAQIQAISTPVKTSPVLLRTMIVSKPGAMCFCGKRIDSRR